MFSLFLSPPLHPGVLLCICLVLIVAQKSLLMTVSMEMWKNMPVSVKENENSFHCCLLFLLPSMFFFPPPSPSLRAMRFLVGSTWSLFLGISLLLSRSRLCVCVGWWLVRIWGYCSLLTQQVLIWLHSGCFVCSTFIPLKHRKGQQSAGWQAEGHRRDKREGCFLSAIYLAWISERGLLL